MVGGVTNQPPQASQLAPEDEEFLKRNTDCVYFLASPLTCKKGNECEYRHSDIARVNPRDCWYWLNGNCLNPKCGFRHPPLDGLLGAEASTPVGPAAPQAPIKQGVACIFFQKGYCLKGHLCPFLHGPPNTVNNVAVQPIPSKPVTKPSKVNPVGPEKHIQEQKPTQYGTVQKPVESLPPQGKQAPKVPLRNGNGVATEKKVAPPPVMNEFQSNHGVYETNHVSDNEEINGNDVEEYSREPTPGFDVLVENDVDDSEYYPNEEQFRRSVDYDVDRDMYPKKRDFERYNEEEYAWEDRRDHSKFGRKRFPRDESPNQFDHSDLRHRLSKQRGDNVGGLRSVISREHPRDHHNDRRVDSGPLSSRLRGRIRIPGRSTSPGYENGSRVEREIYMGRQQRSRYTPERPRFRDRIRGRSSDDFNNQGREYRGYRGNSSEFTGPKRLSELRSQQVDDGQTLGKRKYPRPESQQSEVNASFEGPKPLSEILKRKRGSVISSTNNEDNQKERKEIPSGNTDNEKPANGQSFSDHEPSDAENKVGSVDEDTLLDEELEAYDDKDTADYEYEQIDGEDYNMEEDESGKKESEVYS
ncbi:putative transcription factor C3H family [Helianthus annuus]|nr:putative transcription factor C3H family [Helianthus annuus]KAJ0504925.1 putative transcription factor C3H family [Helianthus annuus]KAJ0674615.1 putative transcription factor C3H family [Helianthus annuus]KAJ0862333.1 putative transcription factor C3H family [Helianthus annuus]